MAQHKGLNEKECYNTFSTWPKGLTQTPEELSSAGLIYSGEGDKCQCIHCGVILKDWQKNETPHRKHFMIRQTCSIFAKMDTSLLIDAKDPETQAIVGTTPESAPAGTSKKTENLNKEEGVEIPMELVCKVCYDKVIEITVLPCAHTFACRECAFQIQECSVCKTKIKSLVRTYLPLRD